MEDYPCVPTISPRFIVPPSASTASSTCSTRRPSDGSPGYPPYNIERTGENAYRISVAVSGFSQGELSIVAKENTLTIKGEKVANENGKDNSEVLYRGIAARAFERALPACRLRAGEERLARERPAPCRSRPRDSRGQEAPQHSDQHPARRLRRWSTPRSPRKRTAAQSSADIGRLRKRPGKPGRFFAAILIRNLQTQARSRRREVP